MRRHRTATLAILVLGAAAFAHAATAKDHDTPIILKATLTGGYLHTSSTGVGTATITITPTQVCWKFAYHGLDTLNISGIHVAPPPAAGKHKTSVFPFTATTSEARQCEAPTKWGGANGPKWLAKIEATPNRFYVIIGTTKYPQGAIGGVLSAG
jgi:CHRD domain